MKTELTVSESQHLIDLGVDPKLASKEVALTVYEANYSDPLHPVFTLADVIEALPKEINGHHLEMVHDEDGWYVGYYFDVYSKSFAPELIDALHQLLCWWLTREPKPEEKCID